MRLQVSIGADRLHEEVVWVNHSDKPYEIDSPLFAGRVLVLVKDFSGVSPDGSPPKADNRFFEGRSRKFAIVIEGKFKQREGEKPYTAEEVQFGSDFEFIPENFPHGPFNAGMKIARWVDPATFYVTDPPHGRPYIMSPYAACMNTLCAYPSPAALSRAVVLSHHDSSHPHHAGEETEGSFVPMEEVDSAKHKWHEGHYWRFLGLKGDPRTDSFLSTHSNLFLPASSSASGNATPASTASSSSRPGLAHQPSSLALGTLPAHLTSSASASTGAQTPVRSASPAAHASGDESAPPSRDHGHGMFGWGAPIPRAEDSESSSAVATPSKKKKSSSRFSLSSLVSALDRETKPAGGGHDHLLMADQLVKAEEAPVKASGEGEKAQGGYKARESLARELGPWRFGDEGVDAAEDSTFIFLDPDHPRTVAQRRKHFVQSDGVHRKDFVYDPDLIYTTSFFTPFADLNTLDIKMGPVSINIAQYFTEQPIRYTLRSTRLAPSPLGPDKPLEEEVFATISFKLVE
ncbi:hypothetical protein JCM6882_003649 [Rhodosporidiobolus microsporus]